MQENIDSHFNGFIAQQIIKPLNGILVVVTGRLNTMTRKQAWNYLIDLGAVIRRKVTKRTDLVLVGDKPGQNANRAKQFGVQIICEDDVLTGNLLDICKR